MNDRELMQQAMEALTVYDGTNGESKRKRILVALRERLKQPEQEPLTNEQLFEIAEIAWRHGWESCRDAEYVGIEAENKRWGEVGVEVVQNINSVYVRGQNGMA